MLLQQAEERAERLEAMMVSIPQAVSAVATADEMFTQAIPEWLFQYRKR